jgi:hypothetical protein
MWVFYHDVAANATPASNSSMTFAIVVLITGLIVLAPSYFERRQK